MGERLIKYYSYIDGLKGLQGKMDLAKRTKIASILAGTMADSPDNIEKFKQALQEITGKPAPNL